MENKNFRELGIDGRIILIWISNMWAGFMWHRIFRLCEGCQPAE
jgi:hypothetical protein